MEKFYSCEEIAERYDVKIITVYDWIKLQKLPAVKIGKQYRITAEDLAEFERRNRTSLLSTPAPSQLLTLSHSEETHRLLTQALCLQVI